MEAINYFFHTHVIGCSKMKVQNAFLTKFMIMKLKIVALSIFIIFFLFLGALPKNLWINFFIEQTVDKLL